MPKLIWLARNSLAFQLGLLCFAVATSFLYFSLPGKAAVAYDDLRVETAVVSRVSQIETRQRYRLGVTELEYFFEGSVGKDGYGWTLVALRDGATQKVSDIPFGSLVDKEVVLRSDPSTSEIYVLERGGAVLYSYDDALRFRQAVALNRRGLAQWGYVFAFCLFAWSWFANRDRTGAKHRFSNSQEIS